MSKRSTYRFLNLYLAVFLFSLFNITYSYNKADAPNSFWRQIAYALTIKPDKLFSGEYHTKADFSSRVDEVLDKLIIEIPQEDLKKFNEIFYSKLKNIHITISPRAAADIDKTLDEIQHGHDLLAIENTKLLSQFSNLRKLILVGSRIRNLAFLKGFKELTYLDISRCYEIGWALFPKHSLPTGLKVLKMESAIVGQNKSDKVKESHINLDSIIGNLNLESLDISYCSNLGKDALANISKQTNLRSLRMTGVWLESLGSLDVCNKLEELDINACIKLSKKSLECIGNITSLRHLSASAIDIRTAADIAYILRLKNLTRLDMSECPLEDNNIIYALGELPKLQVLDVTGAKIASLNGIENLKSIRLLVLNKCGGLPDEEIQKLAKLKGLQGLKLANCQVRRLSFLESLQDLKLLDLSECKEIENSEENSEFDYLGKLVALENLVISDVPTLKDLQCLAPLVNIKKLDLSTNTQLLTHHFMVLQGKEKLEVLGINNCMIDNIMGFTINLDIKELYMAGCENITAGNLTHFKYFSALEILDVRHVKLGSLDCFAELPKLKEINLSNSESMKLEDVERFRKKYNIKVIFSQRKEPKRKINVEDYLKTSTKEVTFTQTWAEPQAPTIQTSIVGYDLARAKKDLSENKTALESREKSSSSYRNPTLKQTGIDADQLELDRLDERGVSDKKDSAEDIADPKPSAAVTELIVTRGSIPKIPILYTPVERTLEPTPASPTISEEAVLSPRSLALKRSLSAGVVSPSGKGNDDDPLSQQASHSYKIAIPPRRKSKRGGMTSASETATLPRSPSSAKSPGTSKSPDSSKDKKKFNIRSMERSSTARESLAIEEGKISIDDLVVIKWSELSKVSDERAKHCKRVKIVDDTAYSKDESSIYLLESKAIGILTATQELILDLKYLGDLDFLAKLQILTSLTLNNCSHIKPEEFDKLSNRTNLTELRIANTQIKNLSFTEKLTKLKRLDVSGCGLKNGSYEQVCKLSNLEKLTIDGSLFNTKLSTNKESEKAASMAESCRCLSTLIVKAGVSKIGLSDIENLVQLEDLSLQKPASLNILTYLENLKTLKIEEFNEDEESAFSILRALTQLTSLSLHNCNLKSLKGIERLENLRYLNLKSSKNIPSGEFKRLRSLTQMNKLNLSETQVDNLAFLEKMPELRDLNILKSYGILKGSTYEYLGKCIALTSLQIYLSPRLDSLTWLEDLKLLKQLKLDGWPELSADEAITSIDREYNSYLALRATKEKEVGRIDFMKTNNEYAVLNNLPYLEDLTILNASIDSLDFLEFQPNLAIVKLAGCKNLEGKQFDGLLKAKNLRSITFNNVNIQSLDMLDQLKELKMLRIINCPDLSKDKVGIFSARKPEIFVEFKEIPINEDGIKGEKGKQKCSVM